MPTKSNEKPLQWITCANVARSDGDNKQLTVADQSYHPQLMAPTFSEFLD